uniref:Uncharacterized protein n=1 Tax=Arundo donax TaxID=35708 RepID=A0A0A9HLV8_ARUDO
MLCHVKCCVICACSVRYATNQYFHMCMLLLQILQ